MKDTPTKGKRAKALLRRSFYSAGPVKRTKNMTQYFQLADRIAGRQRQKSGPQTEAPNKPSRLLSFNSSVDFKSPDKNSSFLLSQLVSSPSPAKATPRKLLTATPSKLLESPSCNTRSRLASPMVNLFQSPSRRARAVSPRVKHTDTSPELRNTAVARVLQSPARRKQSPRVFVAESDTKKETCSPQSTPVKSPACGIVTFGLDSPSHNTRLSQRTGQTPTRRSVRAALFSKSPCVNRTQSPLRNTASPRTLFDRFGSPAKLEQGSPTKAAALSSYKMESPQKRFTMLDFGQRETHEVLGKKTDKNAQKTPSPKCKKVTKTPDSFDKWHRRKPRSNQCSPAVPKPKLATAPVLSQQGSENTINCKSDSIMKESKRRTLLSSPIKGLNIVKESENIAPVHEPLISKKRSLLLSPGKLGESPSKRRRTVDVHRLQSRQETIGSIGSQGFDAADSGHDLSQLSSASLDYFSASNDEVFLSQPSSQVQGGKGMTDVERVRNTRLFSKNSSLSSYTSDIASPKNKLLGRLISDETPFFSQSQSDGERSESPVFGASVRTRNKSGGKGMAAQNSDGFNTENIAVTRSPKVAAVSPGNKKYSPSVSAKSLMHLIQSPLLKSPDSKDSGDAGNSKSGFRSRRSLKLPN